MAVRTVRGRDHVGLLERAADAHGDRLLPDRDVQEAGKIAGTEELLDLLLEAPDEEHLAVEIAQDLLRKRVSLLHFRHRPECTLRLVGLAEKWWEIEHSLPAGWKEARLVLHAEGNTNAGRAAMLLAPANPLRHGYDVTFYAAPHGAATAPKAVARLLTRLDAEGVLAQLELAGVVEAEAAASTGDEWLADAWDHLTAHLPEDWSDVYAQVDLDSSDYLEPAALNLAPVNPARYDDSAGFRFRSARRFGYGASPQMVKRCFQRLDENGITGSVQILWALSDTKPVGTQGPVWYLGGRAV